MRWSAAFLGLALWVFAPWGFAMGTATAASTPALAVQLRPIATADGEISSVDVVIRWDASIVTPGASEPLQLRMAHVVSNVDTVAREIVVAASDAQGELSLTVNDEGEDASAIRHWRSARPVTGALQIRYRAPIHNRLATRGAAPPFELRREGGGFSGAGVAFLLLPDVDVPHLLSVRWDLSALPAGARGVSSLGVGDTVLDGAAPPSRLARSFYMGGRVSLYPENARDRGFFAAWMGDPPFDARELMRWTAQLYARFDEFFAGGAAPRYGVFLRRNLVNPGGGVGLQDSFVGTFDTGTDVADFRLTLTHEMFHTRSPYITNPPGLASQWFPEGLAVFYQRELPWRFGMISEDDFLNDLNFHAGRYFTNSLGDAPFAEVPLRFWEDTRIRTIPYDRGSFYFVNLDHRLRNRSEGRRSLDDLVREMRRRELAGQRLGLTDWEGLLRNELGEEEVGAFRAMLGGAWQIPDSSAFGPCFRRTTAMLRRYELGFEPKVLAEPRRIVRGLVPRSAAALAGLRNGDEILRPVGQDAIQGDQQRELELQIRRDGRDFSIRYLPRSESMSVWQWQRDPAVAATACRAK
jgi:hypothetical protein